MLKAKNRNDSKAGKVRQWRTEISFGRSVHLPEKLTPPPHWVVQSLGSNKTFRMLALRDSNSPTLPRRALLKPFCPHVVVGDDAGLTSTAPDVIRRF
jgi:hypothetical protein